MLTGMNNEAKVRRSTRAVVLGKAKVMSFEDIEVVRAAKEVIKGKRKRGRKRKSNEPEPEIARAAKEAIKGRGKGGRKRKSAVREAGAKMI